MNNEVFSVGRTKVNLFAIVFNHVFVIFSFGIIKRCCAKFFCLFLKSFEIITFQETFLGSLSGWVSLVFLLF